MLQHDEVLQLPLVEINLKILDFIFGDLIRLLESAFRWLQCCVEF